MKPKVIILIFVTLLVSFLVVGCAGSELNTGAPATDLPATSEVPLIPDPALALCDGLAPAFSGAFQASMSTAAASFHDYVSGQTVDGCTGISSMPITIIASLEDVIALSDSLMKANGWQEDFNYSAAGPGGILNGYRMNDSVCMVDNQFKPKDDALCSSNEPIAVCMNRLTADQKIYEVTLNCGDMSGSGGLPPASAPAVLPPAFDSEFVQSMVLTNIPPMIPTSFMIADEMALYPYVMLMEEGIYEISVDFSEDCKGATACHFGVLAGSLTSGNELYSTTNIFVDVDRAVPVTLSNGIEGYFIEGLCGASCSDSLIVWVQDYYQYIIGSKAAPQAFLLDLVNSAIANQSQ